MREILRFAQDNGESSKGRDSERDQNLNSAFSRSATNIFSSDW